MSNYQDKDMQDDDTSEYITDESEKKSLDLGGLFSGDFSNITPLYRSQHGAAELYTATRYGKRFVLKGLQERFRDDPIYAMALAKEFEIGMALDHPNIRRTIGFETIEGLGKVIVLEYVDGNGLDSLLKKEKLNKENAREICSQVASALNYMHSKRIFHRDLKPSNILVAYQGSTVKLIDFSLSDTDDSIVLKNPAGSRRYMAPEQLAGGERPSPATDIYSLGVILSDMAKVSGDRLLEESAEECMQADPRKRPQSIPKIGLPSSHPGMTEKLTDLLSSKLLTYVMLTVCVVLSAFIAYRLLTF